MGYTTTGKVTFSDITCDECGVSIPNVDPFDGSVMPDNGLILRLEGGYGMYWDQMNAVPEYVLCKQHVEVLVAALPRLCGKAEKAMM